MLFSVLAIYSRVSHHTALQKREQRRASKVGIPSLSHKRGGWKGEKTLCTPAPRRKGTRPPEAHPYSSHRLNMTRLYWLRNETAACVIQSLCFMSQNSVAARLLQRMLLWRQFGSPNEHMSGSTQLIIPGIALFLSPRRRVR
jgi:hypothetical protein